MSPVEGLRLCPEGGVIGDRTAPGMGPASKKSYQNFRRNFGRTYPKTWTTQFIPAYKKQFIKIPMGTQGPLEFPQPIRTDIIIP